MNATKEKSAYEDHAVCGIHGLNSSVKIVLRHKFIYNYGHAWYIYVVHLHDSCIAGVRPEAVTAPHYFSSQLTEIVLG